MSGAALTLEICVDSLAGCRAARAGGADRVELCAGLIEGGTTPSAGLLEAACGLGGIDVVALIRPRAGDFLYDADELDTMRRDVEHAKAAGAAGVALGVLTAAGGVDADRIAALTELARPMQVCFHRAFDVTRDPHAALRALTEVGVDRVLTSGQAPSAEQGLALLAELVAAVGPKILVGGGVRPHNVRRILDATGAREAHGTARGRRESAMQHRNPDVRMGASELPGEYELRPTLEEHVGALVAAARG
ncbi:MAG: copper homeostasis protein CutC [Planctomycetota bacterium]